MHNLNVLPKLFTGIRRKSTSPMIQVLVISCGPLHDSFCSLLIFVNCNSEMTFSALIKFKTFVIRTIALIKIYSLKTSNTIPVIKRTFRYAAIHITWQCDPSGCVICMNILKTLKFLNSFHNFLLLFVNW